jgi:hypothetical protein
VPWALQGGGTSDGALAPSLVGLHSKSRSIPEAARPAVQIASAGKWFRARQGAMISGRTRGTVGGVTKMFDRCRYAVTAAPHNGTARRLPHGGRDG